MWWAGSVDSSTVSHHHSRLDEDGLVVREREEPAVGSRHVEGPRQVLATGEPADALAAAG